MKLNFIGGKRHTSSELQLGPQLELVEDPHVLIEAAAKLMQDPSVVGRRKPTSWMQRLSGRHPGRLTGHPLAEVPLLDGRACCAEEILKFDGRRDLEYPFEIRCPTCRRLFRVTLAARLA